MSKTKNPKKPKWRILNAFHPTRFEDNVYSVSFHQEGTPLLDRYTPHFMVEANSRSEAIDKARKMLPEPQKPPEEKPKDGGIVSFPCWPHIRT